MKRLLIMLMAVMLSIPSLTMAQFKSGQKYYDDHTTVFVNTEAPGVHKEYDKDRGCYVWRNGMGSFICLDKNMKPLSEMDKHVHFTGSNNDPDNPEVSPFSGIRKVWDKKRGCYVWKNIYTGDFLGTDKASVHAQEQQKHKEQQKQKEQPKQKQKTEKKDQTKNKEKVGKPEQTKKDNKNDSSKKNEETLITSDEQLRQAEQSLRELKAQIAEARAQGVDLSEYGVDKYVKELEQAIDDYKRKRNR